MKVLTLFKQNIFNVLVFAFNCKLKESPRIFHNIFTLKPPNKYTTRAHDVLNEPFCKTKYEQFRITYRAPHLWNKIVSSTDVANLETLPLFKKKIKELLLCSDNVHEYF